MIYSDPTGHWCTPPGGGEGHAGGCYGKGTVEVFGDKDGSHYTPDDVYAKNKLVELLYEEFGNKLAFSAIMNDPLSAVIDNKNTINSVGRAFDVPPEVIAAIIFREQSTRKMADNVLNIDTRIRGAEHSVGLGAIFPGTARHAWEKFGLEDQIPVTNLSLQKKLTNDNTFNITTITLVLYDKAVSNNIDLGSGEIESWINVLPYYNSSMTTPSAQSAGNNYASRIFQYIPYIQILIK